MNRIVITGGAGFIGSYLVDGCLARYPEARVAVVDALTYAASMANLRDAQATGRLEFVRADICDPAAMQRVLCGAGLVIHAAAESHVDRSFANANVFLETNVMGTHTLLEACRALSIPRVIHISTDEVYGPRAEAEEAGEDEALRPTNPYSASKAAAEMLALAAWKSYGLPIIVLRPNNIYGGRQYPEKLLPTFARAARHGGALAIHGSGKQRRRFLAVSDLVAGVMTVLDHGRTGETYNVGIADSYSIHEVVDLLAALYGPELRRRVTLVEDRPYNDFCYATSSAKLEALGWRPKRRLKADLAALIAEFGAEEAHRRAAAASV